MYRNIHFRRETGKHTHISVLVEDIHILQDGEVCFPRIEIHDTSPPLKLRTVKTSMHK